MIFKKLEYEHITEIKNWAKHESLEWIAIYDWDVYYEYAINEPSTSVFAIYDDDIFIGELSAEYDDEDNCLHISLIINPQFQNRGFGVKALNYFRENIQSLVDTPAKYIDVGIYKTNIASLKCFKKAGYIYQNTDEDDFENFFLYL